MKLDADRMARQLEYESVLFHLGELYRNKLLTKKEYLNAISNIEAEIRPLIKHNPLLSKE